MKKWPALSKLSELPEQPHIILVDNGSRDGTAELVAQRFPHVSLIAIGANLGAAARNLGVLPGCRGDSVVKLRMIRIFGMANPGVNLLR